MKYKFYGIRCSKLNDIEDIAKTDNFYTGALFFALDEEQCYVLDKSNNDIRWIPIECPFPTEIDTTKYEY